MSKPKKNITEGLIHALVWLVLFALPAAFVYSSDKDFKDLFFHFWTQLIVLATLFYINYFFLTKLWLYKGEKILFVFINLCLLLFFSIGRDYLIDICAPRPHRPEGRQGPPIGLRFYLDFLIYSIPVAFAFAIQSGKKITHIETLKKEADNIKLQAELQHLKFQLQPHFFFNALNNIYSSIDLDPTQAKAAIHNLSKLMRYFLQKSEEEYVSLNEELAFLQRYIELMKMRLNGKAKILVQFPQQIPNITIPPLILISLVENAFKHGVSATQESVIDIRVQIENNDIVFVAFNTNFPKQSDDRSGSGIGLSNLKKRLQILYPDKHYFVTSIKDDIFIVRLSLPIEAI